MKDLLSRTFRSTVMFLFLALLVSLGARGAHAAISGTMDFGSTGNNVTQLQTYLASYQNVYPSGLVTGYFGPLTQAAVQRFQAAEGIVTSGTPATTGYGRVGPLTLARLNALMGSGGQVSWDTVPVLGNLVVQNGSTNATISWTTNEPTRGQVYWDTAYIRADEATGPGQTPFVSGTLALDSGGLQTSHTVTIQNLQRNTTYYYLVRAIDSGGNISISWSPGSFTTNQ